MHIINRYSKIVLFLFVVTGMASCKDKDSVRPVRIYPVTSSGLIDTLSLFNPDTNAIYIDPTVSESSFQDGTERFPFNSFSDFMFEPNHTYALKRGTTIQLGALNINVDGMVLCSYGEGTKRPVIKSTATGQHALFSHWTGPSNIIIRDIEIYAPNAKTVIRFGGNGDNLQIINCLLHGAQWGIRSIDATNVNVFNTEVHSINDDGLFLQRCDNIEISYCYVHDVNQNWKPPSTPESEAGGDGIQFADCNHWWVHHNYIDRTSSGNKFCFISNNATQNDGVFEYNSCIASHYPVSGVYFQDGNGLVVRYNYISTPAGSPVYTHSNGAIIHHNIFQHIGGAVFVSGSGKIYNNLLFDFNVAFQGNNMDIVNNILVPDKNEFRIYKGTNISASNNILRYVSGKEDVPKGDPLFVDDFTNNFHLQEGSDCIDAGKQVGLSHDIDGTPLPQGTAPDIGPYEYIP